MANSRSSINLSTPSHFYLALALKVAKTKPAKLSIPEWLEQIKHHVINGSRTRRHGSIDRYIDAVGLWRGRCAKFQQEIRELSATNMSLEKQLDRMRREERPQRSTPCRPEVLVVATPSPVAKRKQDVVPPSHRSTKRPRGKAELRVDDEEDALKITETGTIAVHHLFRIHKCYQQKWKDPAILCYHLIEAADSLAQHVSAVAESLQQQQLNASLQIDKRLREQLTTTSATQAYTEIQRALRAAGRSFASLFYGLSELWGRDTETAKRVHGAVTYAYIQAVATLLSTITATCKLIARQQVVGSGVASSSSAAAPSPQKAKLGRPMKAKASMVTQIPQELTTSICVMLTELTPTRDGPHAALFEGILYHLLERTGDCLYRLTFGQRRLPTVEENLIASPLSAVEAKTVRIEVRMLAQILERAMKLAPCLLGSLSTPTSLPAAKKARRQTASSRSSMSKAPPTKGLLAIAAKEKLQATLVHCMYGGEIKDAFEEDEDSDATQDENADNNFLDRLRKPVAPGLAPHPPKVDEHDIPQWFTEEVWRMVGWDILTRVSDW